MRDENVVEPITEFRPIPFYFINTMEPEALTKVSIFEAMKQLKQNGFGGCIVFNKPPDGFSQEEYLSEKWFDVIGFFAEAGKQLELEIWINDGFNFPPGDAGGRIQKINPDLKQRVFVKQSSGAIAIEEVDWGFPAFEEPESSRLFIELGYEQYKKYLGQYFNNGITGFFSDADCRRFGPVGGPGFDKRMYFPATKNFMQLFLADYHYDLTPFLEGILDEKSNRASDDYWMLCEKLYAKWFKNNFDWCRKHDLKYSFHTSDSGPFSRKECKRSSIFTEGRYFELAKNCDYPGTDHELLALNGGIHLAGRYFIPEISWAGSDKSVRNPDFFNTYGDVRAKYTASAAWANKQKRALCEAFAATNWGCRHYDLRLISTWQIMQGINFFVPHAVHHRLHGETKDFAPPDFSGYGSLATGLREFNDWLSEMCMIASQGELVAPVAVLDPSRAIWSGMTEGKTFFDVCNHLNHSPFGYIIVDEITLLANLQSFKVLVLPDIAIDKAVATEFTAAGGNIINAYEIQNLPKLLDAAIAFEGNAQLQYMHRKLESGEEVCLVANVDNSYEAKGKLRFLNQETEIELQPGEIKVIGSNATVPSRNTSDITMVLPKSFHVEWEKMNMLPLTRWLQENGEVCHFSQRADTMFFEWENVNSIKTLELLLPVDILGAGVEFDINGENLNHGSDILLFADKYLKFKLNSARGIGIHRLKITGTMENPLPKISNMYLSGDFSVRIKTFDDFNRFYREYYSMRMFLPEQAEILLGSRDEILEIGSWAEQGYPFYSGSVKYSCEVSITGQIENAVLVLPKIESVCSVKLNGKELGRAIWPPYEFKLPTLTNKCRLEVTVWNTLANLLEEYRAQSGIIERPFIKGNKSK